MSLWSRIANTFRGNRLSREIDGELRSHMEEAIEDDRGRAEARRALGSALRHREASRDIRLIPWLDSLRSDAVFGGNSVNRRPHQPSPFCRSDWHLARACPSSVSSTRCCCARCR